jgi:hypothetical protein
VVGFRQSIRNSAHNIAEIGRGHPHLLRLSDHLANWHQGTEFWLPAKAVVTQCLDELHSMEKDRERGYLNGQSKIPH